MRSHFIITLFDEDTNKDGYIDPKDLRRMHLFDVNGVRQKDPVPDNYSILSSEYDPGNDRMTVFAALDADRNGKRDDAEPLHIYWIDLKDPSLSGRQY
jgi:dipeptidyl aminopeptidase/acylaminoacyl peptidase